MPGTVLTYLEKYGGIPFTESPVNDVDSLILCQFCYLKFDGMVPNVNENKPSVSLTELAANKDFEKLFADERFEKNNRALFDRMLKSRRYSTMRMNCYINKVEIQLEAQFSAITFLLEDGTLYIAFRGTDETIIGWKEDFNMAFLTAVPGQQLSAKYLNLVTGKLNHRFYVGGHSKGGNLAVYSVMCAKEAVKDRAIKVYSMDGPGFRKEVLAEHHYEKIADKVVKILPHSSIIGMLLEQNTDYRVVKSKNLGIAQHDPFSWIVKNCEFVEVKDIYAGRKFLDDSINEWVLSRDQEQLKVFVDTLYQVITASKTDNLISFSADMKKNMMATVQAMRELDPDTKKAVSETLRALFSITYERTKQEARDTLHRITVKNSEK